MTATDNEYIVATNNHIDDLVQMEEIGKSFSGVQVLKDVQFNLKPGEVHALLGENGAGKSTLMKILGGIYTRDKGSVKIKGQEVSFTTPKAAMQYGIGFIHQELNLIPFLTVTENMFLGRELTYGKSRILRWQEMKKQTKEHLESFGLKTDPSKVTGELSVGQQQMVEIAKVLSLNADILVMDEPTASLTGKEIETLFEVIRHLKNSDVGIIYISHRMEEIFEICDRITVLRDGQFIGTIKTNDTSLEKLVKMMVGREIGNRFPERSASRAEVALDVKHLHREGVIKDISFHVREGEIVGLAGLMGSGRSELVRAIFGADPLDSGEIYLNQKKVSIKKPADAIKQGIALITEDRKGEGLILTMSVRDNLSLVHLEALSNNGVISTKIESTFAQEKIKQLNIKTSHLDQLVCYLSGGNQQKIVIGKWLGISPKVLILDEPTRGVDIGAKKEIYEIINQLTEQRVAILMVSSELPEVLGMSNRILVMHEGRITAEFSKQEADQEKIMHAATGGV